MRRRRFYIAAVRGFAINLPIGRAHHSHRLGVSAHVLDRERLHIVLASYYSEDGGPGPGRRLGTRGAIAAARKRAAELNAWERAQ